ncbi:MAG: hypothetical protein ABIA37_01520 [Candidatus Woesearchaeota archaeon]
MLNHNLQETQEQESGIELTAQRLSDLYEREQTIRKTLETYVADHSFLETELKSLENAYQHLEQSKGESGLLVKVANAYHDMYAAHQRVGENVQQTERLSTDISSQMKEAQAEIKQLQNPAYIAQLNYKHELNSQLDSIKNDYALLETGLKGIDKKILGNNKDQETLLSLYEIRAGMVYEMRKIEENIQDTAQEIEFADGLLRKSYSN